MFNHLKKIDRDVFIAIFLFIFLSFLWHVNNEAPPSANMYPKILIIFSYFFTLLLLIRSLYKKEKRIKKQKVENYKSIFFVTLLTILYIVLIHFIGYGISTVIFMAVLLWILKIRSKSIFILLPIITTLTLYFIFNHVLMVLLPEGYLFSR